MRPEVYFWVLIKRPLGWAFLVGKLKELCYFLQQKLPFNESLRANAGTVYALGANQTQVKSLCDLTKTRSFSVRLQVTSWCGGFGYNVPRRERARR